jgi:hypothetical protein
MPISKQNLPSPQLLLTTTSDLEGNDPLKALGIDAP